MAAYIIRGPIANRGYCLSKFAQSRFAEFLAEQYGNEGLFTMAGGRGYGDDEGESRWLQEM